MRQQVWLHVVNSMYGGVGRVVKNLMGAGIDGYEQKVCELGGSDSVGSSTIGKMATAKRVIGALPPGSLVHLHCGFRSWVYTTRSKGIRYIVTIHGMVPAEGVAAVRDRIELYFLSKRVRTIAAVSRQCKKTIEHMAGPGCSVTVIPNGVPRASTGLAAGIDGVVNVGFVGDFSINKGIHTFLQVAGRLKHTQAIFTVFGNGPEYFLVEKAVGEGLVRWIDNETDPAKVYPQMDVLIFPSRLKGPDTTGCPMVLLEAMSYGVAVVAGKIPGVEEIIEDRKDGILIDGWEACDYAEAVERLIAANDARQALSECAGRKWSSQFSADLMSHRYCLLASSVP